MVTPPSSRPRLVRIGVAAAAIGLLVAAPSAAVADPRGSPGRCTAGEHGSPTSVTELPGLSREDVTAQLVAGGLASGSEHGVARYRVGYCTTGPAGASTEASGLLVLPTGGPDPGRALPVVGYTHGTASARSEAPSMLTTTEGELAPLVFAAAGFAVVAPDYIGLGTSTERHPYVHADTEAGATIDMLVAARATAADRHRPLSADVYLTGHSQGGHAAMAAGERLQRSAGWRLRALAPLAGPYDASGLMLPAALDPARTDPALAPMYLAYLVTSWKPIYRLYTDPHEVFTAPYAGTVEDLFDGTHDVTSIRAALPARVQDLFRPEFLARLAAPSGRLAAALRDNDVCRWRPSAPVRLVAARGDRDVPFEHTERCWQQLRSRGADAQIVDLGAADHIGTAIGGLPVVRDWFSGLDAQTGR